MSRTRAPARDLRAGLRTHRTSVGALAVGAVGAACLYGIVADWQGWCTG